MPEAVDAAEAKSFAPAAESLKKADREGVLNAFNSSFAIFEKTPDEELTLDQRHAKKSIRTAKELTIDQGKNTFESKFENHHTGEVFAQREGIPIGDLMDFLVKKMEVLPQESEERKNLAQKYKILLENSKLYYELPHRLEPQRMVGRIHHEAYLISQDERKTPSEFDDWMKGVDTLNSRRELQIPARKKTETVSSNSLEKPEAEMPKATEEPKAVEAKPEAPAEENSAPKPESAEEVRKEYLYTIARREEDIRKRARETVTQQHREEFKRGSLWNPLNWPRKIGLRVAKGYFVQKFTQRAETMMRANHNTFLEMDVIKNVVKGVNQDRSVHIAEGKAGVEFAKEVAKEPLKGQKVIEAQGELKNMIVEKIIKPIIDGAITDEGQIQKELTAFVEANQNDPQIVEVFGRDASQFGKLADYFASDLLETGEVMKQDLAAHKFATEQINEVTKIQLANISWAAEGEGQFNNPTDKIVAWLEKRRLTGWAVNPATVGAVTSLVTFGGLRTVGATASVASQIAVPGVGTLFGAGLAAARRNYELKVDIAAHRVDKAYNAQTPTGAKRREALDRFAYDTAFVKELIAGGGVESLTGTQRKSLAQLLGEDLSDGQNTNRENVVRRIAEIKSRLEFSERERLDLLSFHSKTEVQTGRFELVKSVAQAKIALKNAGMTEEEIDTAEKNFKGQWESKFTQNREQQDNAFRIYRVRNAAGAAVFGGVAGLSAGLLTQEGIAVGGRLLGHNVGQTILEGVVGFHAAPPAGTEISGVIGQPGSHTQTAYETVRGTKTENVSVLEHFKGELEQAQREYWHNNDTPMHMENGRLVGADGKELQLYHHALQNGAVDLDMSKMVSTPQGVNWDLSVDSQYSRLMKDIITNPDGTRTYRNFEFLITPNDAANASREVIRIHVDANGHAILPQGTDLRNFFEVRDGKVIQLARFVEVAHDEFDKNGNLTGRTILATSVGQGIDNMTVTIPTEQVIPHTTVVTPEPLPPVTPVERPVVIPIPFAPRHPLENLLFITYGLGYQSREGLGWVSEGEYATRRSRTLNENPQAQLDESEEVADYLARLGPAYRDELERMDQAIGSPMSAENRVVITIPAFGEGKIIKKTIEQFLNQKSKDGTPINPSLFEIIVYENDTADRPKDETEAQIRQFKAEHPEFKVQYAYKRWSQEDIDNKVNTVGNGRKYSCDLALLRSSKRTTHTGDLIIVNNDADLEGITPKYLANLTEEFDSRDYLDYVVGKRNLPDWALEKPNIRAGQRMWETFDAVMRHAGGGGGMSPSTRKAGWPGMIGENSAMRASIYAAVGGYGPKAHLAEDQNLGDMIRVARQYDDRRFEYINRLQTIKNPRRYLTTMIMGRPLVDMYNDYHENKDVRNQNNEQLLNHIPDTFDLSRFQLDADAFYQKKAQGAYGDLSQEEFDLIFQRTMGFMGTKYTIENGHVKITDAERLLRGLGATRSRSTPARLRSAASSVSREVGERVERQYRPTSETEPENLLGRINKTLKESGGSTSHYEISPQELVDYVKTFKLPAGKLEHAVAKIISGELVMDGSISVPFGKATFDITLTNDETGGIRVKRHDLVLSGSAGAARGKVEEYIGNLNSKLAEKINKEIDPTWKTDKFYITSDKLAIDFEKKPQSPQEERSRTETKNENPKVPRHIREATTIRNLPKDELARRINAAKEKRLKRKRTQ